ncbi:MAG: serine--tRNA ligase, partial [Rickettsiales bacterium]|nr:serine--tRNA ligase [Rickettsiales bacterium]
MHDIKRIRENPEAFDAAMKRRGLEPLSARILELDKENRGSKTRLQELQTEMNQMARNIGELKAKGENADVVIARSKELKTQIAALKESESTGGEVEPQGELQDLLLGLPNILLEQVPDGADESDNVKVRQWGTPREFSFAPKEHFDIAEAKGWLDFTQTAKMSGARFASLFGPLARLERALAAYMLEVHTKEFGYTEVSPPYMVRSQAMVGTSQLPKFKEDLFGTSEDRWLIPTAEVSPTNLVREQILDAAELPLRYTAFTPCFRAEAGSAGKDTRGLIRQHQFSKVELVSITTPEQADEEHERLTRAA